MSLADQQWCPTSVQVTVLQARGLRVKGKSGTNDAYAVMQVGKEKYQTSVVEKSVAPVWKEEAAFDLPPLHQGGGGGGGGTERCTLHVHVLHRALVGPDKLLGQAVINLLQLSEDKTRNKTEWFKLLDKTGKADKDRGEVLVDIQFMRNNMTASMFDLSGAGKSRSRLGKFKDKVRGKKKESDSASTILPSFAQVLTDSEEEGNGDGEAAAGKGEKKKKHKIKSLFSPKSNLQKNMSQSMSVLPAKNSSLSGSQSSGLNVDSSEGKKKFKFMIHKRSGSSDSKDSSSGHQKHGAAEQSNLCINGSHVYCEEPQPRTSRIGSNFSLASSGHGSMEDVPESSPPSIDSLRAVRQYSPWTEEEEEEETAEVENINEDVGDLKKEEEERIRMEEERMRKGEEEERVRRQEEEFERLAEETRRREEEERRRAEEEKVKKEEEDRIRREEEERVQEERRRQEEEERVRREEEERERLAEEKRRLEEQETRRLEEEKRQREEEERIRMKEEMAQEERKRREEEESTRRLEEERKLGEEKRRLEEERRRYEEEKVKKEEEEERIRREDERAEEERRRREEEEMVKRQEEEREEMRRLEEEERRRREEEERIKKEEERKQEEEEKAKREREECERLVEEKRKLEEEERKRIEAEERIRREEEDRIWREEEEIIRMEEERRRKEEEEERIRMEEERRRKEEEEERIRMEEERMRKEEEEERIRMEEERMREEEERIRMEEERRRKEEEEERIQMEEERRRKEEEERIQMEEERRRRKEEEEEMVRRQEEEREKLAEEKRRLEERERRRIEEEEKRQREEEERIRKEEERKQEEEDRARREKEEMERLAEERRKLEEQERMRIEEEERIKKEEKAEQDRKEEEARKLEKEKLTGNAEEQKKRENKTKPQSARMKSKMAVESPAEVTSTNPFDENYSNDPFEENPNSPAGPDSSTARCQSAVSSLGSKTVSTDEKDPISSQRERRPAPQPPGRNQAERQSQREQDGSTRHLAQINKQSKDKDVKTVSVPPQRSVHMIAPLSRSPTDAKNTQSLTQSNTTKGTANAAKHSKRPAPSRPRSVEEAPSSEPKTASSSDGNISNERGSNTKQEPVVYGLNPFEDDEDENELTAQDDTTSGNTGSTQWPPVAPQVPDKDAACQTKIKSSKMSHAPPLPAVKVTTSSTLINRNTEGGHVTDDADVPDNSVTHTCDPESEATSPVQGPLQEPQLATVQSAGEEAGGKKEGPPTTSRRLQPVKPLNPLEQQSVSVVQVEKDEKSTGILCEVQEKTKVNDTGLKGPYSQLTQEELISLVLKQEKQLSERDKKISELEQYIDNLLVRVMEEKPSILLSMNSLKKAV